MRKVETPEKLAARKAKEQKELAKWRREQLKPKRKFYLIYLVVVLSLVFIMDSVATDICTKMKAEICGGLFGGSTATMDLLGMLASAVMIGGAIYKSMSDRFGRKIFLVINTIAMGAGMFVVYLAGAMGSAAVYIIGSLMITFFIAHDMQTVYVLETMPANRRFTILSIVSAIASLGGFLIPVLRRTLMGNNTVLWNRVFLVPAVLAVIVGLIAMVTARETDVFIENRIRFLEMTDEEREAEKAQRKAESQAQGGLLNAFKFAFRHKQLRWIFICTMFVSVAMIGTMYYQQIMTYGYERTYGAATPEVVTDALMIMPLIGAVFTLARGFISDRFGRKPVALIMASLATIGMVGFFLGALFANAIKAIDHWVAFGLLLIIGANMLKEAMDRECEEHSADMSVKTMFVMAVATSIDALAVGISLAMAGNVNIWIAAALIGITTCALSALGVKIGNIFGSRFEKKAEAAGGIILILLGLKILAEHLGLLG